MASGELYILGAIACFIVAVILYSLMMLLLYLNDRPIDILSGINLLREYFKLVADKDYRFLYVSGPVFCFISLALVPYFFSKALPRREEENCKYQRSFNESQIGELITGKFLDDANHRIPTFWVMDHDSSSNAYGLNNEWMELYKNAQPGDSLIKHRNSNVVTLRRNGNDFKFKIDYGCTK